MDLEGTEEMLVGDDMLRGTVFIVTYGRSGSTLLQTMLNAIPGVCIRGENYLALAPIYESWRRATAARTDFAGRLSDPSQPWFGADMINADQYGRDLTENFIRNVLAPPEGVRWCGFKEIRYANMGGQFDGFIDFLFRFFPNPKLIFNTRAAEAIAGSGWFRKQPRENVFDMVETMNNHFNQQLERRPEDSILIEYEKFTTDHDHSRRLFDLLDVEYDLDLVKSVLGTRLDH